MKTTSYYFTFLFLILITTGSASAQGKLWSIEKANAWYANHKWLSGADYIPATAINQLEMWQADTFDPATID